MDDDTAGDNNGSSREMLYGSGANANTTNYLFDGQINSTSARQGVNADGSNYLSAGFGQATGYWNNEATTAVLPASTVAAHVRPPPKSMGQGQHPQQSHPSNVNLRRSPLPRPFYEPQQQSSSQQHSNPSQASLQQQQGFDARQQQHQGHLGGHMPIHDNQQQQLYEDLFTSPSGGISGNFQRQPSHHQQQGNSIDPRLKDFQGHHHQQFSQGPVAGMRPYVMDNSPGLSSQLDLFHSEAWDMPNEFWGLDANIPFGGHQLIQHRTSLPNDPIVFQQRTQGGGAPQSSSAGAGGYMNSQAVYDASRRGGGPPIGGRQDMAHNAPRAWIPSQISYDSSATSHHHHHHHYNHNHNNNNTLVAPPRTIGVRVSGGHSSATTSSSSSRKSSRNTDGATERKKPRANYSPMAGENRLKITFMSLGTAGETPQHFGTKGYIIPDGLSGTHQVYHQRWRFDIRHEKVDDTVVVSWGVTNLASGTTCQRTETPREARVRETSGHTICNQLLRQALKSRAAELELMLSSLRDNPTKFSNTESLIKALRPKSCILGLLFFGLLHDTVQHRMRDLVGGAPQVSPTSGHGEGVAAASAESNLNSGEGEQDGAGASPELKGNVDGDDDDLSGPALDHVGDEDDAGDSSE